MVIMGEMSLHDCDAKNEKKNDKDKVDGMRPEVYSKSEQIHNKMQ